MAALVRNLTILERLESTTPEDLENMRRGRAPTVRRGPYAGEILSVDHIIPRSVAPELDKPIANLELMPLTLNQRKADSGRKTGCLGQAAQPFWPFARRCVAARSGGTAMNGPSGHLQTAIGYLQLGMFDDANDELEELPPDQCASDEVLAIRLQIYQRLAKWEHCGCGGTVDFSA